MGKFQSAPPVREATGDLCASSASDALFQSAPPVREATRRPRDSDRGKRFQSAPPVREATESAVPIFGGGIVSIRASREGGDKMLKDGLIQSEVSIRASREGGDPFRSSRPWQNCGFNPRLP